MVGSGRDKHASLPDPCGFNGWLTHGRVKIGIHHSRFIFQEMIVASVRIMLLLLRYQGGLNKDPPRVMMDVISLSQGGSNDDR